MFQRAVRLGGPHTESFLIYVLLEKGTVNQKSPKVLRSRNLPGV